MTIDKHSHYTLKETPMNIGFSRRFAKRARLKYAFGDDGTTNPTRRTVFNHTTNTQSKWKTFPGFQCAVIAFQDTVLLKKRRQFSFSCSNLQKTEWIHRKCQWKMESKPWFLVKLEPAKFRPCNKVNRVIWRIESADLIWICVIFAQSDAYIWIDLFKIPKTKLNSPLGFQILEKKRIVSNALKAFSFTKWLSLNTAIFSLWLALRSFTDSPFSRCARVGSEQHFFIHYVLRKFLCQQFQLGSFFSWYAYFPLNLITRNSAFSAFTRKTFCSKRLQQKNAVFGRD